jgi:carboxyl-terminal processing protease
MEPKDDKEWQNTLPMLRLNLKALIARDLWDMNEYFQIWNESSEPVQQAVKLLLNNSSK